MVGFVKNYVKKIVILGHTGFVGSHLENFFKNDSEAEVIGRSPPLVDLTKEQDANSLKDCFDMNTDIIMCSALKKERGDNIDNFLKNIDSDYDIKIII